MFSPSKLALLPALITSLLPTSTLSLGINCRGSGLCPLASWENKNPERVMQILRDAIWQSPKPDSTAYTTGQHIICVSSSLAVTVTPSASAGVNAPEGPTASRSISFALSGNIATGGICVFPQLPSSTPNVTLGQVRPLADKLLEHGCGTCGSVPVGFVDHGSNDPSPGILTFNYVKDPFCTGGCIGADGAVSDPNQTKNLTGSAKFRL